MQRGKRLFDSAQLTNAAFTYYTATNVRAKNLWLTATNPTANTRTVTIYLVKSGGAAADSNTLVSQKTVLPGQTIIFYEACGHVMDPDDFLQAKADAGAAVTFMGSGDEVSL